MKSCQSERLLSDKIGKQAKNHLYWSEGVEILLIKAVFGFIMFFLGAKRAFKFQSAETDDFLPELASFA